MATIVVTPVAVEPVTLAEARLHLRMGDATTEDTAILGWITAAREVAEAYTQRALAPQTLEMALDGFPSGDIGLEMSPVASVSSIIYTDENGANQTLPTTSYRFSLYGNANRVSLAANIEWPATQDISDAVRIRYVTGFAACPKAAKSALLLMIGWLYENRGDSMSPNDIQPPAAKALLNTQKLWDI